MKNEHIDSYYASRTRNKYKHKHKKNELFFSCLRLSLFRSDSMSNISVFVYLIKTSIYTAFCSKQISTL